MKNLILTLGILLLMTMGISYDADCRNVTRELRHLKWVCEEMADAALCCAGAGTWHEAEERAAEILMKNMGDRETGLVWNLQKQGNTIEVKVEGCPVFLHLPLPDRKTELSYKTVRKE